MIFWPPFLVQVHTPSKNRSDWKSHGNLCKQDWFYNAAPSIDNISHACQLKCVHISYKTIYFYQTLHAIHTHTQTTDRSIYLRCSVSSYAFIMPLKYTANASTWIYIYGLDSVSTIFSWHEIPSIKNHWQFCTLHKFFAFN